MEFIQRITIRVMRDMEILKRYLIYILGLLTLEFKEK